MSSNPMFGKPQLAADENGNIPSQPKDFSFFPGSKYEWIKTENSGWVEELIEVKNGFAIFKTGRRCSLSALQESMTPISAGPDNTAEIKARNANLTKGLAVEPAISKTPEQIPELRNEYSDALDIPKITTEPKVNKVVKTKSPVGLVLESNKSIDSVKVSCNVTIDLPQKAIYDVLNASFPDSDIAKEITDLVFDKMDKKTIIRMLMDEMVKTIKNRYKQSKS